MQTETPIVPLIPDNLPSPRRRRKKGFPSPKQRRRFSLLGLIGAAITLLIALGVGAFFFLLPRGGSHAAQAQPNLNCTLIVPANPHSAQGLATPYQLLATNAQNGPCNEANPNQSAFVQAAVYDPATGKLAVYEPLVIDQGTKPAAAPVVPTLPANAVVGIWFGFNANNLLLQGAQQRTLRGANCVNGLRQSLFMQFAYCNAPAFFSAVNQGIAAGRVQVPALGTAKDGLPCPTVRDFSVVDQDQSDNVQTEYLATTNGQTAQFSAANQTKFPNATLVANPSDNRLLTNFIDPTLGCQQWTAPDLANQNTPAPALALDELQAAAAQQAPIALVPLTDPMTLVNNNPSLTKTDLYRLGVDQTPANSNRGASGTTYCQNLLHTGMPRLVKDQPLTINATSPDPAAANSLFTFLAQRFQAAYNLLNCTQLLNTPNPVTTQKDANGVVISATFAPTP